jgi:hypothetical protein
MQVIRIIIGGTALSVRNFVTIPRRHTYRGNGGAMIDTCE